MGALWITTFSFLIFFITFHVLQEKKIHTIPVTIHDAIWLILLNDLWYDIDFQNNGN